MQALRFATVAAVVAVAAGAAAAVAVPATPPMRVTIDITSIAGNDVAAPANFAVRSGGTVTVTIRNHTRLFHTFTIRGLGISVLARPLQSTSVTFVAPYGVYAWRCVICPSGAHPHSHMMRGTMYAIVDV